MELIERPRLTRDERRAQGAALRKTMPRRDHAALTLPDRDVIAIMEDQHASRIPDLVPVRVGRMLQSPFAFYRGSAAVMAHDLAANATTGVQVVCCGDAHVANFGLYATPERALTFDLNDFDEASNAPWEWDVKRLATSALIGALDAGLSSDQARESARASVTAYRESLATLIQRSVLERYYSRGETAWLQQTLDSDSQRLVKRTVKKAQRNTSERVLDKIEMTAENGQKRIVDEPPIMRHDPTITLEMAREVVAAYLQTVRIDIAMVLSQFSVVDSVLRVVGVGSVGTRSYIHLMEDPNGEPFFLQTKEAQASVLETYGGIPSVVRSKVVRPRQGLDGFRVISCQRIMQAASDPFLGYFSVAGRDYYTRQFRDMKGALDLSVLTAAQYTTYAALCGDLLARAHSQSPDAAVIDGYLDGSARFDDAVADWAVAYAEVVQKDFAALEAAVAAGRLPAERGV